MEKDWKKSRDQIVGLGETSLHKSYYPELQDKIESLENSYTNLQEILNSLSDAVIIHDKMGVILSTNDQAKDLFKISCDSVKSCSVYDLSQPDQKEVYKSALDNVINNGKSELFEWIGKTKTSQTNIILQVSINRTTWKDAPAFVAVLRDFSERKRYENALIEARKKAVESDNLKAAFLANMSHEIRTPMNGIMGFLNLLKNNDLDDANREKYIDLVLRSGQRLISTISDIVIISKIDSDTIPLSLERVDLKKMIADISLSFQQMMKDKGLDFIVYDHLPEDIPNIRTDIYKLESIITNILKNAYKFTKDGQIILDFRINNKNLEISIKDTGIGIPSDKHERIFEPFTQADLEDREVYEGSGLGLTISKSFINMLNGEIKLKSEIHHGSEFIISLPVEFMDTDLGHVKDYSINVCSKAPLKILIAEDDEISQIYIREIFEDMTFDLLWVDNGQDAIDCIKDNPDIALILMDIKMPGINGLEATREIRKFNSDVKIIAQTAYAFPNDKEKCHEAGCDAYLSKPIIAQELFDLIANFIPELS